MKYFICTLSFFLNLPHMLSSLLFGAVLFYFGRFTGKSFIRDYGLSISYSVDQLANAVLMGKPDQTISQRLAIALYSNTYIWFVPYFAKFVDWLALVVANDKDHISKSLDDITGTKELWKWY